MEIDYDKYTQVYLLNPQLAVRVNEYKTLLDELSELDMLDAFGQDGSDIVIEDVEEIESVSKETPKSNVIVMDTVKFDKNETTKEDHVSEDQISSCNCNELAKLLSQLLNNKTIEITIKIKD